jgi:hypothetical protein
MSFSVDSRTTARFPARGGTDFIGRLAAKHLADGLGQQVFVEDHLKRQAIEIAW